MCVRWSDASTWDFSVLKRGNRASQKLQVLRDHKYQIFFLEQVAFILLHCNALKCIFHHQRAKLFRICIFCTKKQIDNFCWPTLSLSSGHHLNCLKPSKQLHSSEENIVISYFLFIYIQRNSMYTPSYPFRGPKTHVTVNKTNVLYI